MMDWGTQRKLTLIGSITAVVLAAAGIFTYFTFFNEQPTCFDGKQNQNERGVDCGGICARVCRADARVPVRLWSRSFEIAPGVWSAVAYLENQNPNAAVRDIEYEFRVYDSDNLLITNPITGRTFIDPNSRSAVFISDIRPGTRIPESTFFRFTGDPAWEKVEERFSTANAVAEDVRQEDFETAPKVFATLRNVTLNDLRDIEVIAILYGADGNAVSASKTEVDELVKNSTVPIFFTWQAPFATPVTRVEIIPRVNPFLQK